MLRLLLPQSVGASRARARAERLDSSLKAELSETVVVERPGSRALAALCLSFETEGFMRADFDEYQPFRKLLQE